MSKDLLRTYHVQSAMLGIALTILYIRLLADLFPEQLPSSNIVQPYEHQALASFFSMLLSAALKSDMLCVRAKTCINQPFQI